MIEKQKQRLEQEMTKVVDELDKSYLRSIQGNMHRCAAKCCDDTTSSLEKSQQCIQRCSEPFEASQAYVHGELEHFQSRLQRCVMDCNDKVKDQMGSSPDEKDVDKYTGIFEKCAVKCVDKHIELVPGMLKAMKRVLSDKSKLNAH